MGFKTDTIAAISTAMTNSGIGIVRLSGEDAISIIDKIYKGKNPKLLSEQKSAKGGCKRNLFCGRM